MTLVPVAMRAVVPGEGSLGTPQAPPSLALERTYKDKDGYTVTSFTHHPVAPPAIDWSAGGFPVHRRTIADVCKEQPASHASVCALEREINLQPQHPDSHFEPLENRNESSLRFVKETSLGKTPPPFGEVLLRSGQAVGEITAAREAAVRRVAPVKGEITIHCDAAEAVQALDKLGPDGQRIVEIKLEDRKF